MFNEKICIHIQFVVFGTNQMQHISIFQIVYWRRQLETTMSEPNDTTSLLIMNQHYPLFLEILRPLLNNLQVSLNIPHITLHLQGFYCQSKEFEQKLTSISQHSKINDNVIAWI